MIDELLQAGVPRRNAIQKVKTEGDFAEWSEHLSKLRATIKTGQGVMIGMVGTRGNGKTQAAVELMRDAIIRKATALYVTAQNVFMELRARNTSTSEADIVRKYREPLLLVIDEAGKRGGSEWENNVLFGLLDSRHGDMSDTILISNQTKQEFINAIGPSIASRMTEGGAFAVFTGPDFRPAVEKVIPAERGCVPKPYSLKPGDAGYDYRRDPNHKCF